MRNEHGGLSWFERHKLVRFGAGALFGAILSAVLGAWLGSRAEQRQLQSAARPPEHVAQNALLGATVALPVRARASSPQAAQPKELPSGLDQSPPVTLVVAATTRVTGGRAFRQTKVVTRTVDRIHVRVRQANHEWYFERNRSDPRRVSAILIEHRSRALVEYDESELRSLGIAAGWADVALLGVGQAALGELSETGRERLWNGMRFKERRSDGRTANSVIELWWNSDLVLPLKTATRRDGATTEMQLHSVETRVDSSLLRDPRERFPAYASMDVSDYREKHHEHAPGNDHSVHPDAQ